MNKQNEELFEAMIRIAGREAMDKEVEEYPSEDSIDVSFSPAFERKMRRLIRQSRRRGRLTPIKALHYAAIVISLSAIMFSSAFAFIPKFRFFVANVLVEWTGVSADLTYPESDGIRPAYIPDGFIEVDYWEEDGWVEVKYQNSDGTQLTYSRIQSDGLLISIDSEHSDNSKISINGCSALVFQSNKSGYPSHIIVYDGIYSYRVSSEIPIEELTKMAESLSQKKD